MSLYVYKGTVLGKGEGNPVGMPNLVDIALAKTHTEPSPHVFVKKPPFWRNSAKHGPNPRINSRQFANWTQRSGSIPKSQLPYDLLLVRSFGSSIKQFGLDKCKVIGA